MLARWRLRLKPEFEFFKTTLESGDLIARKGVTDYKNPSILSTRNFPFGNTCIEEVGIGQSV